jgi:hypothetical protein
MESPRHRAAGAAGIVALVTALALVAGCFGYTRGAKNWSYVGDTVLLLGGGGAIASDRINKPAACMGTPGIDCPSYTSPVSGMMIAGVVLVASGLFGILFNATRPLSKSSSR